ncbi:hypothetical protein [Rhizobium rhizogenes]|uniref:hypothetical protein n=1 Tax=Rhizobium rhizogenes TaxID=359 RepID=UPI001573B7CC|nr:hypothetical protein [Rhizobium rhizogenes]NTG94241.1 flavodoxin-dependent (E)-4-hydroxy-3-methylbut-2-enyl-diphosphate synthase [Rhizobium rhizogenes]
MEKREFTSPYLSDHAGGKVIVTCPTCGMRRQYDVNAMLEKIEDRPMPSLLAVIARAEGCERVDNLYSDRCKLHYDLEAMRLSKP